jgi:hypothetical protein
VRRARVAFAVAFTALAVVVGVVLLRPQADVATPSPPPSPTISTAATTSPTVSPTASATASASPSPSPTPQGVYMSKRLGLALTLPAPWRKASCGNSDPGRTEPPYVEQFTSAPVLEEHIGDVGNANDRVDLRLETNLERLTPTQFAQRRFRDSAISPVTFAGRPAVEVRTTQFGPFDALIYIFAEGEQMYSVSALQKTSAPPDIETMLAILRSVRLLSSPERTALPDPTPILAAAPTAEGLAGMLKTAFERKDVATLERLLGPCVSQGVVPGGAGSEPRERFVAELRQQLAAGITVTVDASTINTASEPNTSYVWSKWNAFPPGGGGVPQSPGPQTYNVQLLMRQAQGGWYWTGTNLVHTF